ncbi:MAG: IclR family transcriptional regulator [Pseudomonadota bacterium]|nr:IclR family transcriptional regulator [Pseudomonadota bacterium]
MRRLEEMLKSNSAVPKVRGRDGVIAVDRALSLLDAYKEGDRALSLVELSRRTALDKATILRLAKSLAKAGHLMRNEDTTWRLGPKLAQLGTMYQATFRVRDLVEPALARLSRDTGESASLHIREQDHRMCLFRVDSPQAIRHHTRIGDMLPLHRGAPGHVLLAFAGEPGEFYEAIRRRLYHVTFGERDPQVASVSCPVFQSDEKIFGSISVAGPVVRFDHQAVRSHLANVRSIAADLSMQLGGGEAYRRMASFGDEEPFSAAPASTPKLKAPAQSREETNVAAL